MAEWNDFDEQAQQELTAISDEIGRLVQRYAERRAVAEEDASPPIVVAWAVSYELTSIELELRAQARGGQIIRDGQSIVASLGLGIKLADAFR